MVAVEKLLNNREDVVSRYVDFTSGHDLKFLMHSLRNKVHAKEVILGL